MSVSRQMGERPWLMWILLIAVALTTRVAAGIWWQQRLGEQQFAFGDSESYWHLAKDIAENEPYAYGTQFRVFRAPGYPLLLSTLHVWRNDPPVLAARFINAVLGTLAVVMTVCIARQLGCCSSKSGSLDGSFLAGWLAALYPGAIAMSVMVLSEAPFAPCLMLQLYCLLRAMRADASATRWSLLAGLAGGATTLVRPSWLLFTPGVAAWDLLRNRFRWSSWRHGLMMGLGMCLIMAPWWVRNYQVTGRVVVTTLQLGASLMDGLGPQADGSSNMSFADGAYQELRAEYRQRGQSMGSFEYELNQRLRDRSVAWVKSHPQDVVRLAGVKFARMWNLWPNSQEFGSLRIKLLIAAGYVPLLLLSLVGLWRMRHRAEAWLLLLPAVYLTALHVVFVSSIRYRQPGMLALTPVAATAILGMLQRVQARQNVGAANASCQMPAESAASSSYSSGADPSDASDRGGDGASGEEAG